jgi:hypothetical protein
VAGSLDPLLVQYIIYFFITYRFIEYLLIYYNYRIIYYYQLANTYVIPKEHGLALLKQAVYSQARDMQLDILATQIVEPFSMSTLCGMVDTTNQSVQPYVVEDNDILIFVLPLYEFESSLWSGLALYKKAIENALVELSSIPVTRTISVIPMFCPENLC